MPSNRALIAAVAIIMATLFSALPPAVAASEEKVLWAFNHTDGNDLTGGLIFDGAGNLYGTTRWGGGADAGVVFELVHGKNGLWTEKVLHEFCGSNKCVDGNWPDGGLVFDALGNLYGATVYGGTHNSGVVYELSPGSDGTWSETVLHNFGNGGDGAQPFGSLIFDAAGNLYGPTDGGGSGSCSGGCGTVFQLEPGKDGTWTEKVLHSFDNDGSDGYLPSSGLIVDATGNLFGTTYYGGSSGTGCGGSGCGTVFKLNVGANGKWSEKVLHSFDGRDVFLPCCSLLAQEGGNLYGTADGGRYNFFDCNTGCGVVFELVRGGYGSWTEKVLRAFYHWRGPVGVISDTVGNLYGVTVGGGRFHSTNCVDGCGAAYKMSPGSNGEWTLTALHDFGGTGDGIVPIGNLIFDEAGNLYGLTFGGPGSGCGTQGCGTVFEITP